MTDTSTLAPVRRRAMSRERGMPLSYARRAANERRPDPSSAFRCECGRLECRNTVPFDAEAHRGNPSRFVIVPGHLDGGLVIRAADRYFVVEARGRTTGSSSGRS